MPDVLLSSLPVPAMVSLPSGNLNAQTLTNPVLETFRQSQNTGCMACHVGATISGAQTAARAGTAERVEPQLLVQLRDGSGEVGCRIRSSNPS